MAGGARKRRAGILTGGTGDVNPQFFNFNVTESGAATFTQTEVQVPIVRVPGASGAVTIMEILKVYFGDNYNPDAAAERAMVRINSRTFAATPGLNDPGVLTGYDKVMRVVTTGGSVIHDPFTVDLTDGAGHGILYAADSIFATVEGVNTATAIAVTIRILYRFKRVTLAEYIGIVQSQQ